MKRALKTLAAYIGSMREEAWGLLRGALQLSCAMAFCAFVMLAHLGAPTPENLHVWRGALEWARFPAYFILLGGLAAVYADSHLR